MMSPCESEDRLPTGTVVTGEALNLPEAGASGSTFLRACGVSPLALRCHSADTPASAGPRQLHRGPTRHCVCQLTTRAGDFARNSTIPTVDAHPADN